MLGSQFDPQAILQALRDSTGIEGCDIHPIPGGSNNRLFRIETKETRALVAKVYFVSDRCPLEREYSILTVLRENGFDNVPRPIVRLDALNTGVYSFLEGERIPSSDFTRDYLKKIASFLARLHGVTRTSVSRDMRMARLAFRSLGELIENIRNRMKPFQGECVLCLPEEVQSFLKETSVIEFIGSSLDAFIYRVGDERVYRKIADEDLRLSPADFGAHNMLWKGDGSLAVLDFENGGWDHPLRILPDFLWHDQSRGISKEGVEFFLNEYLRQSPLSQEILSDLDDYQYLIRLEWIMIYLTSILPEKLERLVFSKGESFSAGAYINGQLDKIRERLDGFESR